MGNKIFCENFQNKKTRDLSINYDQNYFKIIFWKTNTKDIFSLFNKKEISDITELNLFYYLRETNDNDNIFLIGVFARNPNFIDLNSLFSFHAGNEINFFLLKVIEDSKNKLNTYFFVFSKSTMNNKNINSFNIFVNFINKIENTPNFLLLLYSNANEEIKEENLVNIKENSNNILIKSLCFIILKYIQLFKNNNISKIIQIKNDVMNTSIKNQNIQKFQKENPININILCKINNNISKSISNFKKLDLANQTKNNSNIFYNDKSNNINPLQIFPMQKIEKKQEEDVNIIYEEEEEIDDIEDNLINPISSRNYNNNNNYDVFDRESSRNRISIDADMIIDNFLYLSNYKAASNIDQLKKLNINYIINCSGDICENVGESFINYLTLNLKDTAKENIECIFYMCIDFINKCKKENKKILVHCFQGISRSAAIVIAYLIYNNHLNVDKAFNFVQKKRKIVNPNLGFFLQLELFYKRINLKEDRLEIFAINSFQVEQPNLIVARLIYHNIILNPEIKDIKPIPIFDQRGVFIICDKNNVFILICSKVPFNLKNIYINYAKDYILKIRENEFLCNGDIVYINEGEKNENLENLLNKNQVKIEFGLNKDLDKYYINFNNNLEEKENNILDENNIELKKGFYFYPNKDFFKILNLDDLNNEDLMIACEDSENNKKIFIWKGFKCDISDEDLDKYKLFVKQNFFTDNNNITEINEKPFDESEDFMKLV